MPKLKRLSGFEVVKIFLLFDFAVKNQKGSHVKLQRIKHGEKQTLTIPHHKEIDTGTLRAIIRQAARFVSADDLAVHFYSE